MCDCNQFWVFLFALVLFSALHFFFFGYILPFFTISLSNWEFNRRAESTYEMQAQWKKCTQNNYKCTDHFDRICERERKKKCRMMAFGMHKNQSNCVLILEHHFFPCCVTHLNCMDNALLQTRWSLWLIGSRWFLPCPSACQACNCAYESCIATRKFDYKLLIMRNWAPVNTIFKSKLKCSLFFSRTLFPFIRSHAHAQLRNSNFGFISSIASIGT